MQSFYKLSVRCQSTEAWKVGGGCRCGDHVLWAEICAALCIEWYLNNSGALSSSWWNHVLFWYCDKHVRTRSWGPVKDLSHTHILVSSETLELKTEPRQESLKNLRRNSGASDTDHQVLPLLHKGFCLHAVILVWFGFIILPHQGFRLPCYWSWFWTRQGETGAFTSSIWVLCIWLLIPEEVTAPSHVAIFK